MKLRCSLSWFCIVLGLFHLAAGVEIITDTSQAQDLEPFAARVRQTLTAWFPYIGELLYSPTYVAPSQIPIFSIPIMMV